MILTRSDSKGPIADTVSGRVRGIRDGGVSGFLGIPFAAPPTGSRRWRFPEPVRPWFGIRDASRFGPHAPQPASPLVNLKPNELRMGPSEDCLRLNVFTPAADDARRPVMVWIHGGGFTIGSSSQAVYDGAPLASRGGVVVVTLNYRLGALGFLRLAEVTDGRIPSTGNEGLLDQLAALTWVRENIGEFGGDPGNVTVFGQSAGAMSVAALLAAPAADGLFHRAIIQSGGGHTCHTVAEANHVALRVLEAAELGPDVDQLMSVDVNRLVRAVGRLDPRKLRGEGISWIPLRPVIDHDLLPRLPVDGVRDGSNCGIPVISGTTADEWRYLAVPNRKLMSMNESELCRRLDRILPQGMARRAVKLYRSTEAAHDPSTVPADTYSAILTDLAFRVPCQRLLDGMSERGVPAYRYLFTWTSPALGGLLGACHAVDLGFTFGTNTVDGGDRFCGTGDEATGVVDQMQNAWLAFAKDGDPNATGGPRWQAYDSIDRATMQIGPDPGMRPDPWRDLDAFWSEIPDETLRRF